MRAIYAARRDVMAAAVRATMPAHVQFTLPGGGMFLWLSVDPRIDTEHVLLAAARESVVFVPGRAFYPHRDRGDGMRLSFSGNGESAIAAGVERLAHVLAAS
jgi:DNA-binding transcriptional MocR family regulator